MQENNQEFFETIARVLIRCFWGGVLLLLIWFFAYLAAADRLYALNARWFGVSRQEFDVIHYCGMAAMKIAVILLFLIPYVCLRIVLRKTA